MATTPVQAARSPLVWAEDVLLADLRDGLLRQPRTRTGGSGVRCSIDGRDVVIFSSNDYLGLSVHPAVREAASHAALASGVGSTGSRHLTGSHAALIDLEGALSAFIGAASATLAPSGYAANMAVLTAVGGEDAVIFSDEMNHASIIDGCRTSRSRVLVYRHRDLDDLEAQLHSSQGRPVIVSDTVFSTEGSRADVAGLSSLAQRFGAWLVLDEAHAVGTIGPGGRGAAADAGITENDLLVRIVTFSKALGAEGAAICGSETVRQLLLQRGRALVYSTALSHPVIAATRAALRVLEADAALLQRLRHNSALLHELLRSVSLAAGDAAVPMVSVHAGEARHAMDLENALWEQGWMVHALRPPTVPHHASRLRVVASALHDDADIHGVAGAVTQLVATQAA